MVVDHTGEVRLCWQSVMEVACGWSVVRRARRRAVSQGLCHVLCSASGDVSVPQIVQSGITATASPSTNAQVRTHRDICMAGCMTTPLVRCLLSYANQVKWSSFYCIVVKRIPLWVDGISYRRCRGQAGMVHSVSRWTQGVQVKLWDPLRTHAIPERLRGVFTTRRYTNSRLPLPYRDGWRHVIRTANPATGGRH